MRIFSYRPLRPALVLPALFVQLLLWLPASAKAATEDIVGTWRKPDQSIVEFKPDGSVTAGVAQLGRWERLRDSKKYVLRFTGALNFYYVTTGRYQRQLTLELPSRGTRTHLDRIDNGPTINPDVPDERTALELEFNDAVASIERTSAALSRAQTEAAEARQNHVIARSLGKISGWIPIAQKKEAEAAGLERSLKGQQDRLVQLAAKLGKPVPKVAAPMPTPALVPQPFQPGAGGMPPFVRPPVFTN